MSTTDNSSLSFKVSDLCLENARARAAVADDYNKCPVANSYQQVANRNIWSSNLMSVNCTFANNSKISTV